MIIEMENEYHFDYINKGNKQSETKTVKYTVIDCQEKVNTNYDTREWILLNNIIKNEKDLRIFKGLLSTKHKIVVKIGYSETIIREYKISQMLNNIPCFITYLCYFSCNNNINAILSNTSICAKDGDNINVLIMKEYELGDMKKYHWNKENFIMLLSIIKCIITSFYFAFKNRGFIHNDAHFGNILMEKSSKIELIYDEGITVKLYGYKPIIMDFESSLFDETKTNYVVLHEILKQIINGIQYYVNIRVLNLEPIEQYLLAKEEININYLLSLIDKLVFVEKIDMYKGFVYNPDVY